MEGTAFACADPAIFVRGGPGQPYKRSSDNVFFSPQLILQKSNEISMKSMIFLGFRGGPTFSRVGGSNFFQGGGGSNCLFSIETHITCDFPGGGEGVRTPCPPPSGSALALIMALVQLHRHTFYIQPRLSLRCSYIQNMEADEYPTPCTE